MLRSPASRSPSRSGPAATTTQSPHNVSATDGADFESETLRENDTYEYTPTKAGTITYVCTIHSA